jgi:hypothetical protein
MSLALHLNRFRICSRVLSVTFCSPISIRCSDADEIPIFRAKADSSILYAFSAETGQVAFAMTMPRRKCALQCFSHMRNVELDIILRAGKIDKIQQRVVI